MSQSLVLSVSGEYTSINDMNGLPPGALERGKNVESRYKNVLEPRRGFDGLLNSSLDPVTIRRLINFYVLGTNRIICLTDEGDLFYFTSGLTPWVALPGFSTGVIAPNAISAKSRFVRAGQNLYVTSQDGVRSLSSGSTALMLRAGVPKGLNLEAETNDDTDGFFSNNVVLATTGNLATSSAIITNLGDTTSIAVDQYVTGVEVAATKVIQDLTYTSELFGVLGNAITIAYTIGGTAGAEVVSVVGNAISVKIATGVSTATQVRAAVQASVAASALVSVTISGTAGTAQTAPVAPTALTGGLDNTIPVGTKVLSIEPQASIIVQTATTTAGSVTISQLASNAGIVAGLLVSGQGISDGARVVSITAGPAPYSVDLDLPAFQDDTNVNITFTSPITVTMDANAAATANATPITFYSGAQVGYRVVFGRVETDINGGTITRLGAPSSIAIANNISPYTTNVEVMATLPKNSDDEITFYQLYRSPQTSSINITPLDQYNLVYEAQLTGADFTARVITITDDVPDSLVGIPLYAGSDREGILQANNPPPSCWDMCNFRNFTLFGNVTQPSTLNFTIVSVGSPSGVQVNDTITLSGTFAGVPFTRAYTGKASENQAAFEFQIVTSGTPSQNITDTANSLIRVINYDESTPVHAILLSSSSDLPGQILLEYDNPSLDTFQVTASAHADAYDPTLTNVVSEVNTVNNGVSVSKSDELEAVPATNILRVGDKSSGIVRVIPLRDYVIVLKTDGIYKIQGITPSGLVANPFDLTTKIIGSDTAVSLNSGVWMLSNQGVVSISDGGVDAKSIPIDNELNTLIGTYLDNLVDVSFAVGYESDRKYILSVPNNTNTFTETQHVFNYVTNSWTRWERNLRTGFIHSNEGKLYISRADTGNEGVSKERKTGTYRDYVDESITAEITSVVSGTVLQMLTVDGITAGDILYQDSSIFSLIVDVDLDLNQITVASSLGWLVGSVDILVAFETQVTWKQVFGDNPASTKQFSEGLALFKNTRFNTAEIGTQTDFSPSFEQTEIEGTGNGLWGLLGWGEFPWGGAVIPQTIRFYIPQNKQLGSYLIPTLTIRQGYSDFKFQGLSITYFMVSTEVGI